VRARGRKAPSSMGKINTAEVPSATLRTGSSTPRHKRCVTRSICEALRSDDDSVGVLTKNILDKCLWGAVLGNVQPSLRGLVPMRLAN
jgi:hypothetical protein